MIIWNRTTKTLKASTLNNRGVRSTPGCQSAPVSTLKGSPVLTDAPPFRSDGALFQSACSTSVCQPGVLATLVPSVIERRPRRGLFGGIIADNHICYVSALSHPSLSPQPSVPIVNVPVFVIVMVIVMVIVIVTVIVFVMVIVITPSPLPSHQSTWSRWRS